MTMGRRTFGLTVLAVMAAAVGTRSANSPVPVSDSHHLWGYLGAEGPEHWGELDPAYGVCDTGQAQSPIDLPGHPEFSGDDITIEYAAPLHSVDVVNNGHTLQAAVAAGTGNRLVIGGVPFELAQYHFHLPSEHTVDGQQTSMELHLVHKNAQGGLAVLGVLLQETAGASIFRPVLIGGPDRIDGTRTVPGPIDLRDYLPKDLGQYQYEGSLTTPPCSEGVAWTVLRTPMPVGIDEAARFRTLFGADNRPTQPVNGRTVVPTEH
ncbi:carbonic anhydrase [Nocardia huaxiensis]|nr:carbonic anhydrase family protein [Nocardia huaxiensis]